MFTKAVTILTLLTVPFFVCKAPSSGNDIEEILTKQAKCWNQGDIDGFMQTYWKSDNLTFSGGGKTTRGWQATLDRYIHQSPDLENVDTQAGRCQGTRT